MQAVAVAAAVASGKVSALEIAKAALARIASLEARRADLATRVEPALLTRYENIRRRRGGVAVTQVVGGTCRGCNRQIPPQIAIVLVRANTIENCPNCNRIIYVPEAVSPVTPPAA